MMSLPRLLAGVALLLLSAFVWPTGVSPKMLVDASGEVFARALLALGLWIGGAVLAISVVTRLRALDRRQRQGVSVFGDKVGQERRSGDRRQADRPLPLGVKVDRRQGDRRRELRSEIERQGEERQAIEALLARPECGEPNSRRAAEPGRRG